MKNFRVTLKRGNTNGESLRINFAADICQYQALRNEILSGGGRGGG